ncbi:MAG: PKD domain-containing protein, partial [Chloroflexia bacterium]
GTVPTATHAYTATGPYTVSLTAANACSTVTVEQTLTVAYRIYLPLVLKGYAAP